MRSIILNVTIASEDGAYSAEVTGRPELTGRGPTMSAALRSLASTVEYMGDDYASLSARFQNTPGENANSLLKDIIRGETGKKHVDERLTPHEISMVANGMMHGAASSLAARECIPFDEAFEIIKESAFRSKGFTVYELSLAERELVDDNKKLQACKDIKNRLGIGLVEAKYAVDSYCASKIRK